MEEPLALVHWQKYTFLILLQPGLFEQEDATTKAVIGNFQGDYFCGSGLGFDDGQAKPATPPGTNDGTDGGKPVICE